MLTYAEDGHEGRGISSDPLDLKHVSVLLSIHHIHSHTYYLAVALLLCKLEQQELESQAGSLMPKHQLPAIQAA